MRSFNYTGRKRITHESVLLAIYTGSDGVNTFSAEFDLSGYKFPSESKVVVEAYYQANWMRFNYGTISQQCAPSQINLDEFTDIEDIKFRVKVTDSTKDTILGLADKIKPVINDRLDFEDDEILPVKCADLNGSIWKVEYSDDDGTTLVIDKGLGDKNILAADLELRALIAPAAMREILIRIFLHEKHYDMDDNEDWRTKWLIFCKNLGFVDFPTDRADIEDIYEWIDNVVAKFCRINNFLVKLRNVREESGK